MGITTIDGVLIDKKKHIMNEMYKEKQIVPTTKTNGSFSVLLDSHTINQLSSLQTVSNHKFQLVYHYSIG